MSETESSSTSVLVRLGGMLGVTASAIGLSIFLVACFGGFDQFFARFGLSSVFALSVVPLVLSVPGLLLSLAGGSWKTTNTIDPGVLGAIFVNIIGLSGALLEMLVWQQWGLFYSAPGGG